MRRWRWACRAAGAVHQGPAGCTGLDCRKSSASTNNGRVLTAPPRPWNNEERIIEKKPTLAVGVGLLGRVRAPPSVAVIFTSSPFCSFCVLVVPFSFALFLLRPSCSLTKSDWSVFQTTRRKLGPSDAPPLTVLVPCSVQYVGGYWYNYACKRWRLFAFCY